MTHGPTELGDGPPDRLADAAARRDVIDRAHAAQAAPGWGAASFVAYAVLHHLGSWPGGMGAAGDTGTRWADWVDLAVPLAVLGPAAVALALARPSRAVRAVFVVGVVLYAQGQGLHLAANSVANADPGEVAHLWDEVIGHLVWYGGWFLVAGSLAVALGDGPPPLRRRTRVAATLLAAAVGVTVATNTLGGGSPALTAVAMLAATGYGLRRRSGLGGYLLVAVGAALLTFAVAVAVSAVTG